MIANIKCAMQTRDWLTQFLANSLAASDSVLGAPEGGKYWQAADKLLASLILAPDVAEKLLAYKDFCISLQDERYGAR